VRKAKERGGVVNAQQYKNLRERENKKDEPAPPLPSLDGPSSGASSSATGRQRSSTNASPGFRSPSPRIKKNNEESNPRMKDTKTLRVGFSVLLLLDVKPPLIRLLLAIQKSYAEPAGQDVRD
jgi:hypothetical protein